MRVHFLLVAPIIAVAGLTVAPTAAADCTSAGGTTICAQGESRGADTGDSPSGSGPYVPYPCEYDWNCNDYYGWEWDLDLDPGPGIGLPGWPGTRPGGGIGGG